MPCKPHHFNMLIGICVFLDGLSFQIKILKQNIKRTLEVRKMNIEKA